MYWINLISFLPPWVHLSILMSVLYTVLHIYTSACLSVLSVSDLSILLSVPECRIYFWPTMKEFLLWAVREAYRGRMLFCNPAAFFPICPVYLNLTAQMPIGDKNTTIWEMLLGPRWNIFTNREKTPTPLLAVPCTEVRGECGGSTQSKIPAGCQLAMENSRT